MAAFERSVLRIDRPEVQQGMTPQHRVRPLMPAAMRGDFAATDPFLALMEDWFPRGVFGKHPHRGIETVTYVLEGRIDHYDNQGYEGVILPGDAQWMTAGRGLIHNEIPAEGVVVHSLAALAQSAGGRQNDRSALSGLSRRCCAHAARAGCGASGFLGRIRRGDLADEELCAGQNGRNPTRSRRFGSARSLRRLQRRYCRPRG